MIATLGLSITSGITVLAVFAAAALLCEVLKRRVGK